MKWIREEYILTYGYYRQYGTNHSSSYFIKVLEIFRKLQDRNYANAKGTFALKCMNYDAYNNKNYKNAGGLEKNQDFKKWILDVDEKIILSEYKKLIKNIDQIKITNKISKYIKQRKLDNVIVIDNYKFEQKSKVTYKSITIKHYLNEIRLNHYKVPLFQRGFVWSKQQIILFLNALYKGYPFGNITVWYSNDNDDKYRQAFYEKNDFVETFKKDEKNRITINTPGFILDGQQRTTSIISLMIQISKIKRNRDIIFSFDNLEFKSYEPKIDRNYIEAGDLFNNSISVTKIKEKYKLDYKTAAFINDNLKEKILDSKIGITIVEECSLDIAIDIFSEMNSTGKKLSLFDIIHAKWLSSQINYDLDTYISNWLDEEWIIYGPEKLVIAKAIYLIFSNNNIQSSQILKYKVTQSNLDEMDNKIKTSLNLAHDFLMNEMKFKPELVPSTNLFKFLPYVFYKNDNQKLNYQVKNALKKYIKFICINNFYSSSTEQKLQKNIEMIDQIFKNDQINNLKNYVTQEINLDPIDHQDLLKMEYNDGSSFYFYVLNILFRYAGSLVDNAKIPVYAANKKSSKINIHHIIPKSVSFQGQKVIDTKYGNSIANLVPILEKENQTIKNKYPSEYYKIFKLKNELLDKTLEKMFIDIDDFIAINKKTLITEVNTFWEQRAEKLSNFINAII